MIELISIVSISFFLIFSIYKYSNKKSNKKIQFDILNDKIDIGTNGKF